MPGFITASHRAAAMGRRAPGDLLPALWLAIFFAGLLVGLPACAQEVVIGQTLALSGPSAATAKELLRGREACVNYINGHGGIRGNAMRLVTRDDQGAPARAASLERVLADKDGVAVMFGAMGPTVNAVLIDWAESSGMTVIDPYGGNIENRLTRADTTFFMTANQSAEAERLAQHIASLGFSRVATVYSADSSGRAAMAALEEGLIVANIAAVAQVTVKPDGSDADAAARQVYQTNAQAVLLATSGHTTTAMLRALAAVSSSGMPLLQIYGLSSAASQADLLKIGGGVPGFSMSQVLPSPRDPSVPMVATFLSAMHDAPGERTYAELEGCMAPLLLADILRRKPSDLTRAGILKTMRGAGRVDLGGFQIDLANRSQPGSRFTDIVYMGGSGRISR